MTDLSKLSDDELKQLYGGVKQPTDMTDDELKAAHGRTVTGILTGRDGGERYQTWPERAIRGILSLPQRTMEAAVAAPPGSLESAQILAPVAAEAALLASPVNPAIRAGDKLIPGVAKAIGERKPVAPTTQELKAAGVADIKAAQASDLRINPAAIADFSRQVQQELFSSGIHPVRAADTYRVLKELETAPANAAFTPANLQTLRETLGTIAQNFNQNAAKDQAAASRVIARLDQFLPSVSAKDVMAGATPGEVGRVAELFERGRGNYSSAMRSNDITGVLDRATTGILERAEGRVQASNSGRNTDNTIRQKVAALLEKPKELSGLTETEIAALERVRDGGAGRNVARQIGNWLGAGGGLGQSAMVGAGATAGAAAAGPVGAAIGGATPFAVGSGARSIANHLARKDLQSVDELLRTRSPLYEERVANPETFVLSPERRAALVRMLMQSEFQSQ